MKVQVKKLPKSKLEIEITTTEEQWEKARITTLKKLGQEVKVDGFRKGHIPENILIEKVGGEHALEHQIIDILMPKSYSDAITKEKIAVIARPEVEIVKHKPLVYKVKVDVYPEVELPDYKKVKVDSKEQKVTKKELDEWVENFRKQVAEKKEIKRAAKKGDHTEVDFEGFTLDGVPLENTKSKNHPVVLGENTLIPGFEDNIIGMKTGEEKEFEITFPKDYHAKKMAGKKVKFKVKLNKASEAVLPEVNEEFVKKVTGQKKSVDEFRKEIETSLLEKKTKDAQVERENKWLEEVGKKVKIELPEVLINEEVDFMIDDLKMRGLQQGLPWEKHLEHLKKTEEELRKEMQKTAEERVKLRLVAQEIIKAEKINVKDEDVMKAAQAVLLQQPPQNREKYEEFYKVGAKGFIQLKNQMVFEKMFKKVLK